MDRNTHVPTRNIALSVKCQQLPPTAESIYDLPHLPLELWSQVLQQVDDPLTLWVTCRRVSRLFKLEAERAFRLAMLPHLQMSWCFGMAGWGPRFEVTAALNSSLKWPFRDDDAKIAAFTLSTKGPFYAYAEDEPPISSAKRIQRVKVATHYKVAEFCDRDETNYGCPEDHVRRPYHALCISFANCSKPENCHVNDPDTNPIYTVFENTSSAYSPATSESALPTKAGTMFLNWHDLLNAFFTEIVFVRKHLHAPKIDFQDLLARAKEHITSRCPYLAPQAATTTPLIGIISSDMIFVDARARFQKDVRTAYNANALNEDSLYLEAYKKRVDLAREESGKRWEADGGRYEQKLKDHVARLREARLFMVQAYAQDLWDSEFEGIEFEYEYEEGEVGFLEEDFD